MTGPKLHKDFFFLIEGNLVRYEGEKVLFSPTAPKENTYSSDHKTVLANVTLNKEVL